MLAKANEDKAAKEKKVAKKKAKVDLETPIIEVFKHLGGYMAGATSLKVCVLKDFVKAGERGGELIGKCMAQDGSNRVPKREDYIKYLSDIIKNTRSANPTIDLRLGVRWPKPPPGYLEQRSARRTMAALPPQAPGAGQLQ